MTQYIKVRKKPVEVKAIELTKEFIDTLPTNINGRKISRESGKIIVETLEGNHECNEGDFLIVGVEGEIYPIRRDIFFKTYDIITPYYKRVFGLK
jgi:hypothetical protein